MNKLAFLWCLTAFCSLTNYSSAKAQDVTPNAAALSPQSASITAQSDIRLGRLTDRHDYSYIGGGFNIGLDDNDGTTIGDTGFIVNGKLAFSRNLSLRPSVIIAEEVGILVPVTYDFSLPGPERYEASRIVPYVGGGLFLSTADDSDIGALVTGGFDVRLSDEFVANLGVNVGFATETETGIALTFGYIFPTQER